MRCTTVFQFIYLYRLVLNGVTYIGKLTELVKNLTDIWYNYLLPNPILCRFQAVGLQTAQN